MSWREVMRISNCDSTGCACWSYSPTARTLAVLHHEGGRVFASTNPQFCMVSQDFWVKPVQFINPREFTTPKHVTELTWWNSSNASTDHAVLEHHGYSLRKPLLAVMSLKISGRQSRLPEQIILIKLKHGSTQALVQVGYDLVVLELLP